jgi:hypothetical protein
MRRRIDVCHEEEEEEDTCVLVKGLPGGFIYVYTPWWLYIIYITSKYTKKKKSLHIFIYSLGPIYIYY